MILSIVIVSYKVKEKLRANLQALFASENAPEFEVFVVDNNSQDGSVEMIKENFPQVKLIVNHENLGFSKANNQAIKKSQGDFILLLNPDMQVFSDTISKALLSAQGKPEAVVSGIKLQDQKGKNISHIRRFPKLFDQLMVVLKVPHFFPRVLDDYLCKDFNYEKSAIVDSVRGAFFMINRGSWQKISGESEPLLDERYFIWFEEVDFCRQVYSKGGEVWYFSNASCLDYVGASFSQVKRKIKQNYFRDSMLKYFSKWESPYKTKVLSVAWKTIALVLKNK